MSDDEFDYAQGLHSRVTQRSVVSPIIIKRMLLIFKLC